jgi:hypothetical protein
MRNKCTRATSAAGSFCGFSDSKRRSKNRRLRSSKNPGQTVATLLAAAAWLVAACYARGAQAQVNVESVRKQLDEKSFGARIRLSLASYTGNTQGIILGTSGLVGVRDGPHLGFATASADYAKLGGITSVKKSFLHLRHNYELTDFMWWEEFGQLETDRFRRIQLRALVGTGPRFEIFKNKEWLDLFGGVSYMLEYTSVDASAEVTEPATVHRINTYIALTARPDERITLSTVMYYQPRFDDFHDAHLLNVSSVEFKVTELLQSRIDATSRYESKTPSGVKHADLELKSSLELKW